MALDAARAPVRVADRRASPLWTGLGKPSQVLPFTRPQRSLVAGIDHQARADSFAGECQMPIPGGATATGATGVPDLATVFVPPTLLCPATAPTVPMPPPPPATLSSSCSDNSAGSTFCS